MSDQVIQVLWLLALSILSLVNILATILKRKKNNPGNYGERIAKLEEAVDNIKGDIDGINRRLDKK